MVNINEIFLADLQDDFELAGKGESEFSIYSFIENDLNRAVGVGYSYTDWVKKGMWIPICVRKEMRHMADGMEHYNAQFKWLDQKYSNTKGTINDYANFILNNIFHNNDLIKIAVIIGVNLKKLSK